MLSGKTLEDLATEVGVRFRPAATPKSKAQPKPPTAAANTEMVETKFRSYMRAMRIAGASEISDFLCLDHKIARAGTFHNA